MAFVGGSFRRSVHSVMEPLAAGCRTLVGPYHVNNREAVDFQRLSFKNTPFVESVKSASELAAAVSTTLANPNREFSEALGLEIRNRSGASRRLVDAYLETLA